jgi:hypothetical protein
MPGDAHWIVKQASGTVSLNGGFAVPDIVLPPGATLVRLIYYPRLTGNLVVIAAASSGIRPPAYDINFVVNSALYDNHIVWEDHGLVPGQYAIMWDNGAPQRVWSFLVTVGYRELGFNESMSLGGANTPAMTIRNNTLIKSFGGGTGFTMNYEVQAKALYTL